ncbi:MAG TPA: MG2 domain-containing protein [Gammaproteobacteria bacterium]
MLTCALLLGLCVPASGVLAQPGDALRVTRITPAGSNVPESREIVVEFDRAVVPLGRMDRDADEIPIEISPPAACRWRWLDTSTLACRLGEGDALELATRYRVVVNPGLVALDRATLASPVEHTFDTERPRITYAWFATWRGPGSPVVRAVFNQPVTAASVREHVYFAHAGAERSPVAVEPDPDDRQAPEQTAEGDARRIWLVSPETPLPADAYATLNVEPGLAASTGELRGDERRAVVQFDTFPDFRFVGVTCDANDGRQLLLRPGAGTDVACNPLGRIGVTFSTPVVGSQVAGRVTFSPDLAGGRDDFDPWANRRDFSQLFQPHRRGQVYTVWLPTRLAAAQTYRITSSADLPPEDEFGRPLPAPIDFAFRTDHRPPDFTLVHPVGVLEAGIDSDVPLYVTNLDEITLEYRTLTSEGAEQSASRTIAVPDVDDVSFAVPLDVRGLIGAPSGALHARITSRPFVDKGRWASQLFAQVTPYQLHVKVGHFNTLVWVVDLATGEPVSGARVSIYTDRIADLTPSVAPIASAETDADGVAVLAGSSALDPALDLLGYGCGAQHPDDCPRLFVRVDGPDGLALLPLDDRFEASVFRASNYAFGPQPAPAFGHLAAWGTTPQGVYRAGETMAFKLYVRDQSNERFVAPPAGPYTLEILDPTGRTVHTIENVTLSEFGAFDGEWRIPETAAVGWYQFRLTAGFDARTPPGSASSARTRDADEWDPTRIVRFPMRVLVSDFTPSPFGVTTRLDGDLFEAGEPIGVETRAALHSGGAYVDAEARITARLSARAFEPADRVASTFRFDAVDGTNGTPPTVTVAQHVGTVDGDGRLRHTFSVASDAAPRIFHGRLSVEGAVRDDRGRYVASTAAADFVAVDRFVGLRAGQWVYRQGEPAEIDYLVVDSRGVPVADTDVRIAIERLETRASRVKGAGDAYLTRYVDEWVAAGECTGRPNAAPEPCVFTPQAPGAYRLIASIEDTAGRMHRTTLRTWVTGRGDVVWHAGNDDALEIVPERTEYAIGDTARYLIQNPYPGARALVTIERFGVLEQWVETLDGSTPIVEFEVKPDYMPGFYLSVVVTSPRVDAPPPEPGEVDLGKPAFKLGYVSVPVRDPYKTLDVTIETDAETYKPGDLVRASIHAAPRTPDRREPIEVAVVVLDEAVLDLIQGGTDYFDPYAGFYAHAPLDVRNFSLLTRLVGRQAVELKGANPGGDGGAALAMRSSFDYVGYFDPSVELDDDGRAEIEFRLPDNLTGWRVLALAVTPTDRMGLGEHRFTANLPTEIRPAMPNQVTEGDRFTAAFTVMNRTDAPRELRVSIRAEGDTASAVAHDETITLEPYARTTVRAPVEVGRVPFDVDTGRIRFTVTAEDDVDGDGLVHDLPVRKRVAPEVAALYGALDADAAAEPVELPGDARPDVGEIAVVLSPTAVGNLDGAFRAARDIDYPSWEQRLTRAVMASLAERLATRLPAELDWPNAAATVDAMLAHAADHQAPNGGMAHFVPDDAYVDPYLSAYTALAFGWLRDAGHAVPQAVEDRLLGYLDALLRRDVAPDFYSQGMTATVRAVALAALAQRGRIGVADLERYRTHVERMSLFGKAHYLAAALDVEGAEPIAEETVERLLAASDRTSGSITFNERLDRGYARILSTPIRSSCAILAAFSNAGPLGERLGLPELAAGLARFVSRARGARDRWYNAQENVFCTTALAEYADAYESAPLDAAVEVALDDDTLGRARFTSPTDAAAELARPLRADDLGVRRELQLRREGSGRVYYTARVEYAPAGDAAPPIDAGVDLRKEVRVERGGEWVLLDDPLRVAPGELVRVDLYVSLPAARNFLVVEDPVPGGLEPVSRDLATASTVDADAALGAPPGNAPGVVAYRASRWSFHHQELRHDVVRFYSDHLEPGNYRLSYTAQAVAAGEFASLPPRAFELYDPDVRGTGPERTLIVEAP